MMKIDIKAMWRLPICCLLFCVSPQLLAGWTELAADDIAAEYVNDDSIEKDGTIATMWNMSDFRQPQAVGNGRLYLSTKVKQAYDCKHKKKRILSLIHYIQPMGVGEIAFLDHTAGQWRDIKTGSLSEVHFKAACKS